LKISDLDGVTEENIMRYREKGLKDELSGKEYILDSGGSVTLSLPAFGAVWLK
jgi:hypothetical protein